MNKQMNRTATCRRSLLSLLLFTILILNIQLIINVNADNDDVADDTYYNQFNVCADSKIVVEDMTLYCDSPGSYYYGSNKYRNSATCQAGDKAKLYILFLINNNDNEIINDPYITINIQGYGTVENINLYESNTSFCNTVTSINYNGLYANTCPTYGYYYIKKQFYWGNQNDNYEYSFIPKITVGIASTLNSNYYDLGGANTNNCYSGNTFNKWTYGVRKSAANTFITFIITFSILLITILSITTFIYCIMKQHNKLNNSSKLTALKSIVIVDEVIDQNNYNYTEHNDYHRIITNEVQQNKGTVV